MKSEAKAVINEMYLGDGVYVSFDGYHIWLDTRAQFPVNKIALEPVVFEALVKYAEGITASLSETPSPAEG